MPVHVPCRTKLTLLAFDRTQVGRPTKGAGQSRSAPVAAPMFRSMMCSFFWDKGSTWYIYRILLLGSDPKKNIGGQPVMNAC